LHGAKYIYTKVENMLIGQQYTISMQYKFYQVENEKTSQMEIDDAPLLRICSNGKAAKMVDGGYVFTADSDTSLISFELSENVK
jgi:hypothetical protein